MHTETLERPRRASQGVLLPLGKNFPSIPLGDFNTMGRAETCDIQLKSPFVSSRHARIEKRQRGWFLCDLQSRNGSFVNGARVVEAELNLNDEIQIGDKRFTFAHPGKIQEPLASKNQKWNEQLRLLPAFANTDFPILMTGPSGTGKDVLARWLHQNSRNCQGPYISINCSALSENLFESELFGHIKGSFTGASADRKGAFESASGGSLFLDEIGDLPLHLQPKLLRALENREIKPLGSDSIKKVNTRVIAATHRELEHLVRAGQFRQDLFFRLNVCRVRIPRLLDRMEDFEALLYEFAKKLRVRLSHGAIRLLSRQPWPGNIRELKNVVSRAAAYFPGAEILEEHIHQLVDPHPHSDLPMGLDRGLSKKVMELPPGKPLMKTIERDLIIQRLIHHGGNQRKVALDLGIPKSTLHDRIKTYGIDIRELVGVPIKSVTSLRGGSCNKFPERNHS